MSCKLKAAMLPVVVPLDSGEVSTGDPFWLKRKLLQELSELSIENFYESRQTFELTIKMIEYHLFYRLEVYSEFLNEIVRRVTQQEDFISEHSDLDPFEPAWDSILKPIHMILEKFIRNNDRADFKVEASLIAAIFQLISSPIEEESKMVIELIKFSVFEMNSIVGKVVLSSINDYLERSVRGEIPIYVVDPIVRLVGDFLYPINSNSNSNSAHKNRILMIVKSKIIPLFSHYQLFWIQESFSYAILQYFSFFEVASGMSVRRSMFEPIFPINSPFEDSEMVLKMRHDLLREPEDDKFRLNQIARIEILQNLYRHQFFPRSMIPEVFDLLKEDFVKNMSPDSAFHLYSFLNEISDIITGKDEISEDIKVSIVGLTEAFDKCSQINQESRTVCHELLNQARFLNAQLIVN